MTADEAVVARIEEISAVTALVDDRVFALKAPQDEKRPLIVVQKASDVRQSHFRGGSLRGRARVQVDVHVSETSGGDPKLMAEAIVAAVNGNYSGDALAGWRGTLGSPPLTIEEIRFSQEIGPLYEAEELRSVRIIQEYDVFYMT